jgi:phosphotransferase system HPr (HPr) family protein
MTASGMQERSVQIVNRLGLHARPAAEFVKLAGRFSCEIRVEKDGLEVNGKSIMGVLMLAAEHGSWIVIRAEGTDAEQAIAALAELVGNGFHEVYEDY